MGGLNKFDLFNFSSLVKLLITADFPISKHAYISAALSLYLIKYRYNPNSVQKIAKLRIAGYIS